MQVALFSFVFQQCDSVQGWGHRNTLPPFRGETALFDTFIVVYMLN